MYVFVRYILRSEELLNHKMSINNFSKYCQVDAAYEFLMFYILINTWYFLHFFKFYLLW